MSASMAPDQFLSHERIEARFGSYGVEVLESDGRRRVSNLYSVTDGGKVCRTYAQVRFAEHIAPAFAQEHRRVIAGESIGTVFKLAGWAIAKRHLHIGKIVLADDRGDVARLMNVDRRRELATHTYVFEITMGGRTFDYAVITEMHHPEHLTAAELASIYGPVERG